jgi:hypothetical protein
MLHLPVDPVPGSQGREASMFVLVFCGDASLPIDAVTSLSRSSSSNSSSESRMTRILANENEYEGGGIERQTDGDAWRGSSAS